MRHAPSYFTTHTAHPRTSALVNRETPPATVAAASSTKPGGRPMNLCEQQPRTANKSSEAARENLRLPRGFKLSVVVPVFNEVRFIDEIVRRVVASPVPKEIVIVDDFSTDGTRERLDVLARQYRLKVILHERNQGKGAAVRTGLAACTGDVALVQDADLEYDPAEYPELIRPIVEDRADVVFGSRYLGGKARDQRWTHRLANTLLTWFSNVCTGLRLTDMETCYKVFRRSAMKELTIEQNRFGLEPELTAKIARRRLRVCEVPVSYRARGMAEGKKIRLKDAFQALFCIVRYSWFA